MPPESPSSSAPPLSPAASDELQFDRAETAAPTRAALTCIGCKREIHDQYFEIAGKIACSGCAAKTKESLADGYSARTFGRAAMNGALAAILGAVVWGAIRAVTGYEIGLVAVGVGILVGITVKKASKGVGGKRYQALAMFLTYSAVAMANVPLLLKAIREHHASTVAAASSASVAVVPGVGVAPVASAAPSPSADTTAEGNSEAKKPVTLGKFILAWMALIALAYAAPFFGGSQSIIGLLIIGFGVYEAWKLNQRATSTIRGPFRVGA